MVAATMAACGGSDGNASVRPGPPAIRVDATEVPARALVEDLRVIAANDALARVLKQEDETTLVPAPGTIDPLLAQSRVTSWVNQILADRELRRRGIRVTDAHRAMAKRDLEHTFRGARVFAAFPEDFRKRNIERAARMRALQASFPAEHEPTDAQLRERFTGVEQACEDGKLIAQIYVDTSADADRITNELAQGADFATLARAHSQDSSADDGGVAMCIGSVRFQASETAVQEAARRTAIGGTSAPVKASDGFAILRILPLTYDNARELLASDWHSAHPNPFYDFLAGQLSTARVSIARRFGAAVPAGDTVVIHPPVAPVKL